MKRRIRLLPYSMGSKSSRALSSGLNGLQIDVRRQTYPHTRRDMIINWGAAHEFAHSIFNTYNPLLFLNPPSAIQIAQNKRTSYGHLRDRGLGDLLPPFTSSRQTAQEYLAEGHDVVVRRVLNGHAGVGIEIVRPGGELPHAPLYTRYVKKRHEYRVHVLRGRVIDMQVKRKRREVEDPDYQVRNFDRGWVFCRENLVPPPEVTTLAVRAVGALGLDFGAADIGWNEHFQRACLYEVNTAPGLEGTTLQNYIRSFLDIYGGLHIPPALRRKKSKKKKKKKIRTKIPSRMPTVRKKKKKKKRKKISRLARGAYL